MTYNLDMSMMRNLSTQMNSIEKKPDSLGLPAVPPKDSENMLGKLDSLINSPAFEKLAEIKGITDTKASMTDGKINISFSFKDLVALNKAYNVINAQNPMNMTMGAGKGEFKLGETPNNLEPNTQNTPDHAYFVQKGAYLVFTHPSKGGGIIPKDKKKEPTQQGMEQMSAAMYECQTNLVFDKKVKSIKAQNMTATQDGNKITIKGTMQDMLKEGAELKIKLK